MKRYHNYILLLFIVLYSGTALFSQDERQVYSTKNGELIISGIVGDSLFSIKSSELIMSLDYETAELRIRSNQKNMENHDEVNSPVKPGHLQPGLLFEGKLGIDYVITKKHPPLDFTVEGYFFNGADKSFITGTGHLEHIHANEYACLLNLDFTVLPDKLSINWPGNEPVHIQIIQTVLKRINE